MYAYGKMLSIIPHKWCCITLFLVNLSKKLKNCLSVFLFISYRLNNKFYSKNKNVFWKYILNILYFNDIYIYKFDIVLQFHFLFYFLRISLNKWNAGKRRRLFSNVVLSYLLIANLTWFPSVFTAWIKQISSFNCFLWFLICKIVLLAFEFMF